MKNISVGIIMLLLLSCHGNRQKVISGLEGKPLPAFKMLLMDSVNYLNTASIPLGQPFVLFYFSPSCPYCRAQTQAIKNELKTIKDIKFYFMSQFPIKEIKEFEQHYSLSDYSNITFAQITDTAFSKYYTIPGIPYMVIYNKNKILKEVLLGKTDVDVIRDVALDK